MADRSEYIKGLQFALNVCRPLWSMSPDQGRKLIGVIVASLEAEIKRARKEWEDYENDVDN